jgi:hypothetical protein
MPHAARAWAACRGSIWMFTFKASMRSAEPHGPALERLPCFATGTPLAATTNEETVETLKVRTVPPPVPQRSAMTGKGDSILTAAAWNAEAIWKTSELVSPRRARSTRNRLVLSVSAAPATIRSAKARTSSLVTPVPSARIIGGKPPGSCASAACRTASRRIRDGTAPR